jgi:hypothetical protein
VRRYGPGEHPRSKSGLKYWTAARAAPIVLARRAGVTLRALAEEHGLSHEQIRWLCNRYERATPDAGRSPKRPAKTKGKTG